MNPWVKIITFAIGIIDGVQEWYAKHRKEKKINAIDKAVDTPDDADDAKLLRDIAERVEKRKKTS